MENTINNKRKEKMKKFCIVLFIILLSTQVSAQKFENIAQTPPMGWNSWNRFGCDVSEKLIKEIADAMVKSGMKDAGYQYIVIDDCWQVGRDSDGNIIPDPERFPSGIKALADHTNELKSVRQTTFNFDYKVKGVGTAACGDSGLDKYAVFAKPMSFKVAVVPIINY